MVAIDHSKAFYTVSRTCILLYQFEQNTLLPNYTHTCRKIKQGEHLKVELCHSSSTSTAFHFHHQESHWYHMQVTARTNQPQERVWSQCGMNWRRKWWLSWSNTSQTSSKAHRTHCLNIYTIAMSHSLVSTSLGALLQKTEPSHQNNPYRSNKQSNRGVPIDDSDETSQLN